MSTFSGFLDEIDHISIDRFIEENFHSKIFFLSHCHMDHMEGLSKIDAENELPGPLYLSHVSMVIIQRKYPSIKNLIPLKVGGKLISTPNFVLVSIFTDFNLLLHHLQNLFQYRSHQRMPSTFIYQSQPFQLVIAPVR